MRLKTRIVINANISEDQVQQILDSLAMILEDEPEKSYSIRVIDMECEAFGPDYQLQFGE